MADSSSGTGVLGVMVGALIVIIVGGGLLYTTGTIGQREQATVKFQLPKVDTNKTR